ncbi:hypothetical protein F4678DRAFT_486081 [Xylaria arbuscula]|nr:hypothetical protein F4678DRAFT_486081 [Xylaria arbuscula]
MARTKQTKRRRSRSRHASSHLEVQELSPPSSPSPPLSGPSSLQHTRELLDERVSSTARVTRSGTRYGETIQCTAPGRVVAHPRETAYPLRRPNTSQRILSSQKAKEQQTTKLINVLAKNKSLIYKCMDEDEDEDACKALMMKICKSVDDPRFKTWRQVKSWAKTHHRKRRGNRLRSSTPSSKRRIPPKTRFERNLAPIISVTEMNTNAKVFLSSVIETLGTSRLTRAFRHRLARGELPDDIAPLIFSPLYLKMCRRQVEKVTAARNASYSGSEGSDDSEWSDWGDYDYDSSNGGSISMTPTGAYPFIIPSIEEDATNIRETIEEEDVGNIREHGPVETPADEERMNRPSTPTKTPEAELCELHMRTTRRARRREKGDDRNNNNSEHRGRRQRLTSSPCPQNTLAYGLPPDRAQVQSQARGVPAARDERSGMLFPPAPCVRPFADLMSQIAAMQSADAESISRIEGLLRDTIERRADGSLDVDSVDKATRQPQDSIDTNQRKENGPRKEAAGENQRHESSTSNTTGNSQNASRPKCSTISSTRRTCLVIENGRLREKVAEPVKTRGPYREIPPTVFYNESVRDSIIIPPTSPELRVRNNQQHKPSSEHNAEAEKRKQDIAATDTVSGRSNDAVLKDVQIQQQRSWSDPSHIFDSDDEGEVFPPIEEICEGLVGKRLASFQAIASHNSHTSHAATMPAKQLDTTRNSSSHKKRHRQERSSLDCDISALALDIPTKRMKTTPETSLRTSSAVTEAEGSIHTDIRISNAHTDRRGSSAAKESRESNFRQAVRPHKSVPANYGRGRGESITSSSGSAPPLAKRRRGQKSPWRIVDPFLWAYQVDDGSYGVVEAYEDMRLDCDRDIDSDAFAGQRVDGQAQKEREILIGTVYR